MKKFFLLPVLAALTACVETPATTSPSETAAEAAGTPIATLAQFQDAVVGKTLSFNGNTFKFNADGTLSGPWDGQGISGNWNWDNGSVCRTATIGSRVLDPDCQSMVLEGSDLTVTRDRGTGQSFVYKIS